MIQLKKNGAIAEISPLGAEMRVYRTPDGIDRLWSGNLDVWAGVAPVLFPVIGALKNQVVRIGGQEYPAPRHGFARNMPFQLTEHDTDSCAFVLEDTPDTRKVYPFAFRLIVRHRLLDNGFATEFEVENRGGIANAGELAGFGKIANAAALTNADEEATAGKEDISGETDNARKTKDVGNTIKISNTKMPFLIGGHPGFACPMNPGEDFSDYCVIFEKEEQGRSLLFAPGGLMGGAEIVHLGADRRTLALDHAIFDHKDTLVFAGLNSRSVKLVHKDTGKGLRFSFPNSPVLAIWTKPDANAPYVCLEPWNGIPAMVEETGDFEDKPYHVAIGVGERFRAGYGVEMLEIVK